MLKVALTSGKSSPLQQFPFQIRCLNGLTVALISGKNSPWRSLIRSYKMSTTLSPYLTRKNNTGNVILAHLSWLFLIPVGCILEPMIISGMMIFMITLNLRMT